MNQEDFFEEFETLTVFNKLNFIVGMISLLRYKKSTVQNNLRTLTHLAKQIEQLQVTEEDSYHKFISHFNK